MCRLAIVADAHVAASRQEGYEMLNELYHSLNPIAFTLGPLQVHWYALAYLAGFVLAGVVAYRVATILKPSPDFSMKSLSTRVFLFLVMVRGAPSPYSATTCWALK